MTAENVGADYNLALNTTLFLESEVVGINESGTLSVATTGGKDLESLESWRTRMIDSQANKTGTGSKSDIIGWIEDSLGDVRGQVFPRTPANGEIQITYVTLNPEQISPTTGGLSTALSYVQDRVEDGATNEVKHEVSQVSYAGTPFTDEAIELPNGVLASLGTITWQGY